MKKNHIHQLLAAPLFASLLILSGCKADDEFDTSNPMIFGSSVSSTRAMIESTETLQSLTDGFGVYGMKNSTDLFFNQQVKYNSSSTATDTKWEYSPIKYWDVSTSGVTYYFSAYAPHVSTTETTSEYVSYDTSSHSFTINNLPQYQDESTAFDLLVADNQKGAYSYFPNGIVDFNFYHKLAKIIVRATKEESESLKNTDYYITNIAFGGDGNATGSLTAAQNAKIPTEQKRTFIRDVDASSQSDVFNTNWTAATDKVTFFSKATSALTADDAVAVNSAANIAANKNYTTITTKVVTPFDLSSGCTIPITVKYVTKSGATDYVDTTPSTVATSLSSIKPGYVYYINLKVGAVNVSAEVLEVQKWIVEDPVENSVYNW